MIRLRDVSLRTKLYTLLIAYPLTMAAVMGVRAYALARYSIGGPVYKEMSQSKELVNELLPPPLLLGRPYLMVLIIESSNNPDEISRARASFDEYEIQYKQRRDF